MVIFLNNKIMSIKVEIICDSINSITNDRLTTFVLRFPRFINAEILRHRCLSFSSASSRAIPVKKIIDDIINDPAVPVWWGKSQSGMQADVELDDSVVYKEVELDRDYNGITKRYTQKQWAEKLWLDSRRSVISIAQDLLNVGLHKQISNRILEAYQNITMIVSGTEWENFFKLRASSHAQPEFRVLAEKMLEVYNTNIPKIVNPCYDTIGLENVHKTDWHIPFGDKMPDGLLTVERLEIAIARCARISYLTQDGEANPQKDFELYNRLISSGHWSPSEHVAYPTYNSNFVGNFKGWCQYRKLFPNENATDTRVIKRKVVNNTVI